MNDNLIKSGACSLILGKTHYERYFPIKDNKLLKISKVVHNHDEFVHLDDVRKIKDYEKYYTIPDKEIIKLSHNNKFLDYLKTIVDEYELTIITGKLNCMYINYGGNMDLLDSIKLLVDEDKTIWKSAKIIMNFTKHILMGLDYLHQNQICHLDIKPENIMINTSNNTFTIIDFGFSSKFPFDDYIDNIRGTPGYFPLDFTEHKYIEPGLPKIYANDMTLVNGKLKIAKDRSVIYKIDSYCFGRVLQYLYYYYQELTITDCFCYEYKTKSKISQLINILTEDDVFKRKTISEVLKNSVF